MRPTALYSVSPWRTRISRDRVTRGPRAPQSPRPRLPARCRTPDPGACSPGVPVLMFLVGQRVDPCLREVELGAVLPEPLQSELGTYLGELDVHDYLDEVQQHP